MTKSQIVVALLFLLAPLAAQTPDPSTLPLVQQADLVTLGGFRVPNDTVGGDFSYGGVAAAFQPAGPSLFLASGDNKVAEISIPAELHSELTMMPRAVMIQGFVDILSAHKTEVGPNPADVLGGLLVHNGLLAGSAFIYYDANDTQERSHFSHSLILTNRASFRGFSQLGQSRKPGFVAGPMTPIPIEWQAKLGGNALTGQCCLSIISRTSYGPSAFAIDAAQIGLLTVPATGLLYYPSDHPTLGPWNGSNPTYGGTTQIGGMVIVPGTRTLLYFGSNGVGAFCYGDGSTLNPPPPGECYDPMASGKGQHAYPYNYQVWAYDLNDLAAVKAKRKQPWDVKPYGVWRLDLPSAPPVRIASVAIDPATKTIYAVQFRGEGPPGGQALPVVWALRANVASPR